jgi:hypothetical protein
LQDVTAHASMVSEQSLILAPVPTIPMSHYHCALGSDLQPVQCLIRRAIVFQTPGKQTDPARKIVLLLLLLLLLLLHLPRYSLNNLVSHLLHP